MSVLDDVVVVVMSVLDDVVVVAMSVLVDVVVVDRVLNNTLSGLKSR